ncbi:hypothetical protein [Dokdonella soli]|uniref:DUF3703 domain-containing protein n=1 Tax=Dokdonella soli TaxID=529810 RepID=A0ABN1IDM1_9GAMM
MLPKYRHSSAHVREIAIPAADTISFFRAWIGSPLRVGLRATRSGGTLRNIPPASVYRISRRLPSMLGQA